MTSKSVILLHLKRAILRLIRFYNLHLTSGALLSHFNIPDISYSQIASHQAIGAVPYSKSTSHTGAFRYHCCHFASELPRIKRI